MTEAGIAVAMIVRDEQGRVGRALGSVRSVVASWLVIDTGSSDSTVVEVHQAMAGVPGQLLERPWLDFGSNRSQLLDEVAARPGVRWVLVLDADHEVPDAAALVTAVEAAEADALLLPFNAIPRVWTPRLLRWGKPWWYDGRTREYLACAEPFTRQRLDAPVIIDHADGASRAGKWARDIELLRQDLAQDPQDARRWFYLGESYRGTGQPDAAVAAYTNCAMLTRSPEEKYLALTMSGEMLAAIGDVAGAVQRLLLADAGRPARREALLLACQLLNQAGRPDEVRRLLGRGDVRRELPRHDVTGIVPGAYDELLRREQARALKPR